MYLKSLAVLGKASISLNISKTIEVFIKSPHFYASISLEISLKASLSLQKPHISKNKPPLLRKCIEKPSKSFKMIHIISKKYRILSKSLTSL
jgi:hypothetical protein